MGSWLLAVNADCQGVVYYVRKGKWKKFFFGIEKIHTFGR
jgi:hypothetical protein